MDLTKVKNVIERVRLPDWVKGWRVTEDLDSDNEPMLRVWIQMDREFDEGVLNARFDETQRVQDAIRQGLREAGIDEWTIVVWESAVHS